MGQLRERRREGRHALRYLLVSETDVKNAKGSWEALKGLGGAERRPARSSSLL